MATSKSLLVACTLAGVSAFAANQASASQCGGYITQVIVDGSGKVGVSTTGDGSGGLTGGVTFASNYLCNLNTSVGTTAITAKACEKMYNSFVTAYLSGRPVSFWFTGNDCPSLGSWTDAWANSNQFYNVVIR